MLNTITHTHTHISTETNATNQFTLLRTAPSNIQLQGVQIKKNAIDGARGMDQEAKTCEESLGGKTRKRPVGRRSHTWRGILKKSDRRP